MVGRFFLSTTTTTKQHRQNHHFSSSSDQQIMLLAGPPSCGKTSLLFQFAFNTALDNTNNNNKVVFICNRSKLENKPPYFSKSIDPSSDVFQRIEMKYVEDDQGIKKYFAAFHLLKTFPAAVIVDDFGDFFDDSNCQAKYNNQRGRDLAIVRTLALCRNAITHANERMESRPPCKLLLSDTQHGDTPRLLFIYKRWVHSIFTIKGTQSFNHVTQKL
ncbi:hypothetical protein AQUCO_10000041v1 [Aquilegia coerulea]|uniref:ATPase AAA-type core domain-containing protein n=1 Tax=Aquilegia coerulea TaxID=218851 RepID=A0A2G5C4B3_AQUCA|nr:hypothetical protein AQUCO_10000041v1 [Aquilegia coerulea]